MEREYQTYQYLTGNVENGLNPEVQYIILQDGSVMIDKKDIQYVIVEDNKEVTESASCPVYDVHTQQFYTDISVPPDLVPISANSAQTAAIANEYENKFSIRNSDMEMVDAEHDVNNLRHTNQEMDVDTNIEITENDIALSEEQCEMLQQKGWILLEMNDKVFFIDTSGLHDVTDDPKLVNKLKHESQMESFKSSQSRYDIKTVMLTNDIGTCNTNDTCDENSYIETDQMEPIDRKEAIEESNCIQPIYVDLGQEKSVLRSTQDSSVQTAVPLTPIQTQIEAKQPSNISVDKVYKPSNVVLNTQFLLKDIPREVILGRTVNGKNLVARVIKGKGFFKSIRDRRSKNIKLALNSDCGVNEVEFTNLVKKASIGAVQCTSEDVSAVETLVLQLLQMEEYGPTLPEQRLIITKTVREENEDKEVVKKHNTVIITGRVVVNEAEGRFVHIPDLLQQYVNSENANGVQNDETETRKAGSEENIFLHIDVTETKAADNISRMDLTVKKRYVILGQRQKKIVVTEQRPEFKCRGCGNKFTTKKSAKRHEARSCTVLKSSSNCEPLNVNTYANDEQLVGMNTKMYKCNECNEKFVKQKEFLNHTRTHGATTNHDCADDYQEDDRRCKLCSNTYSEPSQLTQHILEVHVNSVKPRHS